MRQRGEPLIDWLLRRNAEQAKEFTHPDAVLKRAQYRARHPTAIAALKCMDGRLLLPYFTNTPPGIIQPFRNIGGIFDLGWPFFGALMKEWIEKSVSKGNDCLVLITYHYSRGDAARGCAGYNFDTEAGKRMAFSLREQFARVFGDSIVIPLVVGIETDEDALIFHGAHEASYSVAEHVHDDTDAIRNAIVSLYPSLSERALDDLMPLVIGNREHVTLVRRESRTPVEAEHHEQILAVGRGFDWLHMPNKALIVGPFSYDLADPLARAGSILLSNINEGKVPREDGAVLISSAPYRGSDMIERHIAKEKALSLLAFAKETLEKRVPDLMPFLVSTAGILDAETRVFTKV